MHLSKHQVTMRVAWSRLIRFVATDGRILRGEPILPTPDFDLGKTTAETKLKAKVIVGDNIYDDTGETKVSDEVVTVKKLLGPLTRDDADILRCVGLNYARHSMGYKKSPGVEHSLTDPKSKKPVELRRHILSSSSSPPPVFTTTTRTLSFPRLLKMIKRITKAS
jgi:hypothetical protein